ncbi:hypothetical protein [Vibrio sp. HN007]|uniref:hypothetical protein n=1 Tax=Vibrio iocasae TaxID=3098914 RepID=UPI0035D42ADF
MIKFDIGSPQEIEHIIYMDEEYPTLRVLEKLPDVADFIRAPRLICMMIIFKIIFKLEIENFDYDGQEFKFEHSDSDRVEELFDLYKSVFEKYSQYLVILYEDSDGLPQTRFETDVNLKPKIIKETREQFKQIDLLQVANGVIIDAISIRKFGGYSELINRINSAPIS